MKKSDLEKTMENLKQLEETLLDKVFEAFTKMDGSRGAKVRQFRSHIIASMKRTKSICRKQSSVEPRTSKNCFADSRFDESVGLRKSEFDFDNSGNFNEKDPFKTTLVKDSYVPSSDIANYDFKNRISDGSKQQYDIEECPLDDSFDRNFELGFSYNMLEDNSSQKSSVDSPISIRDSFKDDLGSSDLNSSYLSAKRNDRIGADLSVESSNTKNDSGKEEFKTPDSSVTKSFGGFKMKKPSSVLMKISGDTAEKISNAFDSKESVLSKRSQNSATKSTNFSNTNSDSNFELKPASKMSGANQKAMIPPPALFPELFKQPASSSTPVSINSSKSTLDEDSFPDFNDFDDSRDERKHEYAKKWAPPESNSSRSSDATCLKSMYEYIYFDFFVQTYYSGASSQKIKLVLEVVSGCENFFK